MYFILADIHINTNVILMKDSTWNRFISSNITNDIIEISLLVNRLNDILIEINSNKLERNLFDITDRTEENVLDIGLYRVCIKALIQNGVIHLHSSFVLYNGKAILFTGPSGIGKTTQAELWRDYLGATIVNGDVTLIRKVDGTWTAFGAPIHGTSPYCENMSAPIVAVITLAQGSKNRISKMGGYEALCFCMQEIYRPAMEEETKDILYESMDGFFSEIPVYHLSCRPDEDSVMLVKKELNI